MIEEIVANFSNRPNTGGFGDGRRSERGGRGFRGQDNDNFRKPRGNKSFMDYMVMVNYVC